MTIKKKLTVTKPSSATVSVPPPSVEGETGVPAAPAAGGATIADRFKLDLAPVAAKPKLGKFALAAVIAAFLALGVAGLLTFTLWKHWEFLQGA